MKHSKTAAGLFCLLTLLVTLFNLVGFVYDSFFYDLKDLPEGEFLFASMSPDGDYTLKVYRVQNSLGTAVRGELIHFEDGETQAENIYWEVDANRSIAGWLNDSVVTINGNALNIQTGDTFDSRRKLTINQVW